MADRSPIEWTEATWNPVVGCSIVSPGCTNCYAMKIADRIEGMIIAHMGAHGGDPGPMFHYEGTTTRGEIGTKPPVWTGKVALAPDSILFAPLRWKNPRRIFVNSMGDLFHERVPDDWIDRVFAVMALCPQHTFQVLTKRSARMRAYLSAARSHPVGMAAFEIVLNETARSARSNIGAGIKLKGDIPHLSVWPLPNVWLGVSSEDQQRLDEHAADLVETPAAIRFVSAEPLLGPLTFRWAPYDGAKAKLDHGMSVDHLDGLRRLDWVIVGGESGRGARPMHPDWVRSIHDQCAAAGVPFFFKQWGEFQADQIGPEDARSVARPLGHVEFRRVGKKAAGRKLFGIEHNGMPAAPLPTSTRAAA